MTMPHRAATATAVDYDPFAGGALQRVVPTTEPQREVWLADRLGRDASLGFNESVSLRLRGALDIEALLASLQALVDRHDALRANIGPDGETFCVLEALALEVERIDLSALDAQARDEACRARLRAAVDTPFALESDRLLRAELLRLGERDHLLLLTAHHVVCDGWSWWVLVRELSALYGARVGGAAAALPPAEDFAAYALEEAMHPGGPAFRADEAYWLQRFANGAPVLDLPTDRPRPARRGFASAREDVCLDAGLVTALRRMGARRGASLFATLLGGFAATLGRIAGQSQVVVGIPAAGQSIGGHDGLVGHCVNTLPLLFDLDMAQPAATVVDDAQRTLLDALEHQRYTFGTLLKTLRIARDPARLPLISVLFNIDQALDQQGAAFPGLELDFACNARSHENFELFVNAVQVDGGLRLECQYSTALFDAATVRRWLEAYGTALRALAERPEDALRSLPLVDAPARARLDALQPAATAFDRGARVHTLFERQCDRAPDRIAVRCGAVALTYAELDARANRIARLLRAHDVHPGALVGLAVDRGVDMLASLLGILKAGAGYVPLDPGYPPERLAYMAGDAGLAALVTQSRHAAQFDLRGRPVLTLEALDDHPAAVSATRLDDGAGTTPKTVAYVIYTSGSTGRPKGVQVPHRAVVNFLGAMRAEPGLSADDVLVAVTTLSFDIAVLELLLPLHVGAQVVIAERETAIDGVALARLLSATDASVMQATPATWRMLIETGWTGARGFRALCGGEPLPPDLATALLSRSAQLWNLYGPTETTVWSTCARVQAAAPGASPDVHIGRPIANTQVWIVDAQGALCPEGVPGEIWIGGDGVTLGYLYRPELSAEKFVPDRFGASSAGAAPAMLYRTGDRGRWRADGNLEHQGRLDFQVKVRGFRIELGEIENVLLGHPDVVQAVAMAREDRPGDVRLVAYVARRAGEADAAALAAHLRGTLPDYMIPQHFVPLDAIPLLPNGKVDRHALPVPDTAIAPAADRVMPRNAVERTIAAAMAQVLGQPEVGVHDDFFAIGGHSLLAAQLTTRLNRELGSALSLRALFDGPTVAKLAAIHAALADAQAEAPPQRAPILRRADQSRAPLSLVQERLRLLEAFNPGMLSYNTPSAHRLTGALDVAKLDEAVRRLAQRQTVLRTTIAVEDGEPVQVIHDEIDTGLAEVIDLSQLPQPAREVELARRMRALVEVPFDDLARGPLFVARLYRLADDEHALFFMPHHIVWDGWSFDLLYADLAELYAALVEGRVADLPDLPVTYGDYAAWHRDWILGPEYAQQVAFWRERLSRENAAGGRPQALPTDKPRKRGMSGTSRSCAVKISGALTDRLQATSRGLDVTLFVTLLGAYSMLLGHRARQHDMVIGTPVRGRNSAEVEGLMGYFTNLLPLRLELDPDATFADLARQVRGVVLDSFAAPDIRLEDLTRELSLKSEGGGSMLYQALFSFQDIRHRVARWGDLEHRRIEVFQPGATEDLGLWFVEDADGLTGGLIYNADILEDASIVDLRSHYVQLLREIARDPKRSLTALMDDCARALAEAAGVDDEPQPDAAPFPDSLPDLPESSMSAHPATLPSADPRERYLLDLWSGLLETEVKTNDNFFDLGGNSMLAVQMADRVARETGFKIKLMRLAVQNLAELAADLPRSALADGGQARPGGFLRNVRRLFGGEARA